MKWAQKQKSCRYIENCVKMELQKSRNRYAWVLRGDTFWFTSAKIISHACTIMQFSNMKPCTLTHWNKNWRYLNKKPTTSLIFRYPLIMLLWLWFLRSDTRHSWLLTVVSSLLVHIPPRNNASCPALSTSNITTPSRHGPFISVPSYSFAGIYGSDDIKVLYGLA